MLKKLLGKVFGGHSPAERNTARTTVGGLASPLRSASSTTVQYPPQDPGFICPAAQTMVDSQQVIIRSLKLHAASNEQLYQVRFLTPIANLAALLGNLPGSASGVYAGEGGLFRASLEMGFNCFRAADGRIFTGANTVEERHLLEGRWRYVCFAAGLLYPIGAPLQEMQVMNASAERWSPELDALTEWAGQGNPYWVSWNSEVTEPGPSSLAGMLIGRLLGRENIDWLNTGTPEMIRRLVEVATGSPAAAPLIANSVVKEVWASIHERETARLHQNYGRLVVGTHTSPYLIDSMVMLAKDKWKVNQDTLFVDANGVYLEWPKAAKDIIEYCSARGYKGIPASENALLAMLLSNKLISGSVDGVAIEEIANSDGVLVGAVRLTRPGLLIDDMAAYQKPGTRPVSVAAVVAADPIVAPTPEKPKAPPKPQKAPAPTLEESPKPVVRPTLDTLVIDDGESDEVDEDASTLLTPMSLDTQTIVVTDKPKQGATAEVEAAEAAEHKPTPQGGPFVEGEVIEYSSLVPRDISERLKPHSVEVLGKVIHAWRNKTEPSVLMRMTNVGAAVEQEWVLQISMRGPDAVLDWASQGLLYIDQGRPGIKFHQIAAVEGGQQKVPCVVFSPGAVKTLGMKQ